MIMFHEEAARYGKEASQILKWFDNHLRHVQRICWLLLASVVSTRRIWNGPTNKVR